MKIENALFSSTHTTVDMIDNDNFIVYRSKDPEKMTDMPNPPLAEMRFQKGPTKETDVNGIFVEDLLLIVLTRLQGYQKSEYACRENACAITKIEEAVMWLRKRTDDRKAAGKYGTSTV